MITVKRILAVPMILACGACASATLQEDALSIEFGQDRYLSDSYLSATAGSRCGSPAFALDGTDVVAPLPDGSWFRVVAVGDGSGQLQTVVLERGVHEGDTRLTMRLDEVEGIVRLKEDGRSRAWGIHHAWADRMRNLGSRARGLDCAE